METDSPRNRRQRTRRPAATAAAGRGRNGSQRRTRRGSESSLGGRTTTRALVAVGTYVAQDLRDAEGLTRPVLRRAALRLALSRREPARRLGDAYLRLDPPAPGADPRATGRDRGRRTRIPPGPSPSAPGGIARHDRRRADRVEVDPHPLYHEHMLITAEESDAAPTD